YEEIDEGYVAFGGNPKGEKLQAKPVVTCTQYNGNVGTKDNNNAGQARKEKEPGKDYILLPLWTTDPPFPQEPKSSQDARLKPSNDVRKKVNEVPRQENECKDQEEKDSVKCTNRVNVVRSTVNAASNEVNVVGRKSSVKLPDDLDMPELEDISIFEDLNEDVFGAEADLNNLESTFQASPIPTIRIHKDHPLEQVIGDLYSAPQTRIMSKNLEDHGLVSTVIKEQTIKTFKIVYLLPFLSQLGPKMIEKEVYVCQPLGFKGLEFRNKVYKVEKALYGLHQAPRAWYETLPTYLLDNRFQRGKIDKILFIRRHKDEFYGRTHFFLGLQVKQKKKGIFISQDTYVDEILKKFGFFNVKTANTPMETQKPMLKNEDGKEVDNPKVSHIHVVKRIFRYLYGQPKLGLWYLKDSHFDLMAHTDSDYTGASLDRSLQQEVVNFLDNVSGKILMYLRFIQTFLDKQLDELPTYKEKYDVSFHTKKVFANIKRIGKGFSGKETSLFLTMKVLDLEDELQKIKTAQQTKIDGLERRVKKLDKMQKSRTHKLKRLYKVRLLARVESYDDKGSGKEDASKQGRIIDDLDADKDITLMNDQEMFDVDKDLQGKEVVVKQEVDADYQLAERLQIEEQQELNEEEKAKLFMELLEKRRKFSAAKRAEEKRNRPPTKSQQRSIMCTYLKNMEGYKLNRLKNKSFADIQDLFDKAMKRVNTFVDYITELVEESSKKVKVKITQEESSKRAGDELEQETAKKQKIVNDKETTNVK
nr:hypothetical protein [Tanacetum cinerariifolium]